MSSNVMLALDSDSERIMIVFTKALIQSLQQGLVLPCRRSVLNLLGLTFLLCFLPLSLSSADGMNKDTEVKPYAVPRVLSIAPTPYQSSYDTEVTFEVKFNKSVTGVDKSDFKLMASSGLTDVSIIDVAGQGSLWFVRLKIPVDSDGYVGIELKESGTDIVGAGGTPSTGFSSGQYHYSGAAFDIEKAVEKGTHELPEHYNTFHFSRDGKKVLFLDSWAKKIVEYDLATPYRIGTRETLDNANSLSLTIQSYVGSFTFDLSGLKLFVFAHGATYEYRLTKSFDLSTLISTEPEVHNTGYANTRWMLFSDDGKKLFKDRSIESHGDGVGEHNLSGPYVLPKNLSNARIRSKILDGLIDAVKSAEFNVDGTKMYALETYFNKGRSGFITENEMSEAYNASKLEFIKKRDFTGVQVTDFMFNDDGTIMYLLDAHRQTVDEWHMFTPPSTTSINLVGSPARNATSIQYEVKFSKPVTGVKISDFELEVSSEIKNAAISGITGEGDTYVLTVSDIEAYADGHLRINLHSSGVNIRDANDAILSTSYTKARYHYAGAAYDVSRALYSGLNESFSLAAQVGEARSFSFNDTGKKMIVLGKDATIRHYVLSEAYDVSTAKYEGNKSFSVASQHSNPRSLAFNNSGTKMYVLGAEADDISEYSLTAPYNPSTATYSGDTESFSVKDRESDPTSLAFNDDGTKMFVLGTEKDAIQIYKLHLPFDVSTAAFLNIRNIASFETNPYSIVFNPDGTKMYILGANGDNINEFKLVAPYQPIDATYAGNAERFSTRTQDGGPRSMAFGDGGARMFVLGKTSNRIHEFDLDSSPPRLTGVSVFGNPEPDATSVRFLAYFNESITGGNVSDFEVRASEELSGATVTNVHKSGSTYTVTVSGIPASADGTLSIGLKSSGSSIKDIEGQEAISGVLSPEYHYVGDAFNTAKAVYAGSNSTLALGVEDVVDMAFGKEGKSLFIITDGWSDFYEYALDIPYEVSSASKPPIKAPSNLIIGQNAKAISFNKDGKYLSVLLRYSIYEHVLESAYGLSNQKLSYKSINYEGRSIAFNGDGSKLFILQKTGIFTYRLNKPYNVVDAVSQSKTTSLLTNEADPTTFSFNLDGTRLFVLGNEKKKVQLYDLTTPFDLSTLQYSGDAKSMDIQGENITSPESMLFNEGGTGLFVLDKATSTIHKYYMDSNPAVAKEIKLKGSPMTSATSVDFLVSFSKRVTGVDKSDFDLKLSEELEGASITSVSGDGPEYVVTISNIPEFADGTVSISLKTSGTDIKDEVSGNKVKNYIESDVHYAGAAFNISRAIFTDRSESFSVKDKVTVARSLAFSRDGTKMFVLGKNSTTVYEYILTEPYAVATATFTGTSFSVAAEETNPRSITFSNDGKALFVLGTNSDKVHKYKVIRPFDLSTANLLGGVLSFSVKEEAGDARSLTFSRSGDKMFVLGASSVKVYDLPISFDITTAKFSTSVSIKDQESKSWSLAFNPDGTNMYVLGNEGDDITQYKLTSAFDINTAVYLGVSQQFSVADKETTPRSMVFNEGGTKLFVMGNEGNDFHEYDLNTAPTTVTIASDAPQWVGEIFKFTITFSSPITGFDQWDIASKNGQISSFKKISPTVYTAKIDPRTEGEVSVRIGANKAEDIGGNGNLASDELIRLYDQFSPNIQSNRSSSIEENSTTPAYVIEGITYWYVDIPYPRLVYGLGSGNDESLFNVNSDNGEVTFKSPPDYESPLGQSADNTYKIEVTAADKVHVSTKLVTITVTNVIDNAPVFTSPKNVSFAENETIAAYHPKATGEEKVTFGFSSSYDRSLFKWENGKLFFKEAPDFESPKDGGTNNTYRIQVNANEGGLQTRQLVTITITNVENEGKPVITSANGRVFYENNLGFAYTIVAEDENPLTYRLGTNKDEAIFNITDNVIHFKTPPDFETPLDADANNVYEIKVIVSDGTYEAAKTVNITVRNKDEIPPVFTSANQTNFDENGTGTVYTAVATDEKTVTYELGTGNDEALFNLSKSTGLLTFKTSPDFEDPKDADADNAYLVNILAKDNLNSTTQPVTIIVTNVDDTAPVFTSLSTASFAENGNGTAYTAMATDENTIVYSLGTGKDEELFNLTASTGLLTFKISPDFENPKDIDADNHYKVSVVVNDGNLTATQIVTISVTNVDDTAPVFTSGGSASFAENASGPVYTAQVTDSNTLSFSFGTSNDESLFNVDVNSGVVTFKATPDFETPIGKSGDNTYLINVIASDGINSVNQDVTITVTDVDEVSPSIISLSPANGSTDIDPGTDLVVTFSEPVVKGVGKIIIARKSDKFLYSKISVDSEAVSVNSNVVTINPSTDLPTGEELVIFMRGEVFTDVSGNDITGVFDKNTWNFTAKDMTPPSIVSLSPFDGSVNVAPDANLVIAFSEPVVKGVGKILIARKSDKFVYSKISVDSEVVSVNSNVVTINPSTDLPTGEELVIFMRGEVFTDVSGNDITGVFNKNTWNFTAKDMTPPSIVSLSPFDGSVNVVPDANLVITFSEPVVKGVGKIIIARKSDKFLYSKISVDSEVVSVNSNVVTINPPSDLPTGEELVIFMRGEVFTDVSGNDITGVFDKNTWNLTAGEIKEFAISNVLVDNSELAELKPLSEVKIHAYPNPANSLLTIDLTALNGAELDIDIVGMTGVSQFSKKSFGDKLLQLDVSEYKSGIYIMQFSDGISIVRKKLVIKH